VTGAHRSLVLETLGELGPLEGAAIPVLLPLLAHEDPQTRYWATFALGRMGPVAFVAVPSASFTTRKTARGTGRSTL
jgi:hypothetical protein